MNDDSDSLFQDQTQLAAPAFSLAALTPDCALDALKSVGLYSDDRLLALNSYENRAYQVGIEDGPPLVLKFSRPRRWSDAAIREEHAFIDELVAAEIPAVPAMQIAATAGMPLSATALPYSNAMAAAPRSWTMPPRANGCWRTISFPPICARRGRT